MNDPPLFTNLAKYFAAQTPEKEQEQTGQNRLIDHIIRLQIFQ
jgi:hypothetical protein